LLGIPCRAESGGREAIEQLPGPIYLSAAAARLPSKAYLSAPSAGTGIASKKPAPNVRFRNVAMPPLSFWEGRKSDIHLSNSTEISQ